MIDLAGKQFGRLTVLLLAARTYGRKRRKIWWVRCVCDSEIMVPAKSLASGKTRSCGCLRRENSAGMARAKQRSAGGQFVCLTIERGAAP